MPSKNQSESTRGNGRHHRRREISGIVLLAGGLFSGLSLISMHVGDNRMMGIGGEAIAGALYAIAGLGAYLVVAGMLVAAVRCFRGRQLVEGMREAGGAMLLVGSVAILLHLPFADSGFASHGPGGLLGEWLGGISAAFIGSVGAALGASTTLVVSLLLITDVSTREVAVVLAWAGKHAVRGLIAARSGLVARDARGVPREGRSRRPERTRREPRADESMTTTRRATTSIQIHPAKEIHPDDLDAPPSFGRHERSTRWRRCPRRPTWRRARACASARRRRVSEKVVDPERAAMAAIVAEVAAVERFAPEPAPSRREPTARRRREGRDADDRHAAPAASAARGCADHRRARVDRALRQQEAAEAAAAAELSAEDAARLRDEKRGFIKLG
jgi:hypothetical protein